jgi:hypothetical protein
MLSLLIHLLIKYGLSGSKQFKRGLKENNKPKIQNKWTSDFLTVLRSRGRSHNEPHYFGGARSVTQFGSSPDGSSSKRDV